MIRKYYNIYPLLNPVNRKVSPVNIDDIPIVKFLQSEIVHLYCVGGVFTYDTFNEHNIKLIFLDPPNRISSNFYM